MQTPSKSIFAALLLALALHASAAAAESFADGVTALSHQDYPHAMRVFSAAAAEGDAKSQFALAEMYRQGQGVRQDYAQAVSWYRRAAAESHPGAAFSLGMLYETGHGVRRDDRQAAQWYAKAGERGYTSAQVRLGALYADGRGVPQSDAKAQALFRQAANLGDPEGAAHLRAMGQGALGASKARFYAMMDHVFGAGRWRETSGYRSAALENALRKQGAGTVPVGERSHHSMGNPDAPGAYDIVVDGVPAQKAAAKLKRSGAPVARVVAELAHGNQGPHLHIEPLPAQAARRAPAALEPTPRLVPIATNASAPIN
jgi:hypothetical protein